MLNTKQKLSKIARNAFLSTINFCFELWRVDNIELGAYKLGSEYRGIRPRGENCHCWGMLSTEEEMKYYEIHILNCFEFVDEMQVFCRQLTDLIKDKGKQLNQKKKQVIKKIKAKDTNKTCFDYSKHAAPINKCTNSEQLAKKEERITKEIEQLSSQTQANKPERKGREEESSSSQEEWEKRNQEETEFLYLSSLILCESKDLPTLEKNYQIVKSSPLYTAEKKTFAGREDNKTTLDNHFNTQKTFFNNINNSYKQPIENPDSQENNYKNDKEPNNLKNKFHELYQKGKKYNQTELTTILQILNKLEKETDLDNNFRDAKVELQIIKDKLAPYLVQVGEITQGKLKGLSKQELENCKKILKETGEIIHLSIGEENLLKEVNDKLKNLLEKEIQQLKNNKAENPQQQIKNQKKIEQKEQELAKVKEENKGNDNWNQEKDALEKEIQKLKVENKKSELDKKVNQMEEVIGELEKEINQLRIEIQEIKKEPDNSPECQTYLAKKQAELQDKQSKLKQLRDIIKGVNSKNQKPHDNNSNNFPACWAVGGGLLFLAGLVSALIIKKKKTRKIPAP